SFLGGCHLLKNEHHVGWNVKLGLNTVDDGSFLLLFSLRRCHRYGQPRRAQNQHSGENEQDYRSDSRERFHGDFLSDQHLATLFISAALPPAPNALLARRRGSTAARVPASDFRSQQLAARCRASPRASRGWIDSPAATCCP